DADAQVRKIEALTFSQVRQASEEGRLYGSVGVQDLAAFLAQNGIPVEKRRIGLDEPIKTLGEYTVPIRLHPEVTAHLKVTVARG
ncbi:MAG: 50S ribosomal protein L9, partial [Candidatus Rokubacteria bacterium]|nr:50S ribosomal protein L9 [Candidatus Rokubacteria bacterium]